MWQIQACNWSNEVLIPPIYTYFTRWQKFSISLRSQRGVWGRSTFISLHELEKYRQGSQIISFLPQKLLLFQTKYIYYIYSNWKKISFLLFFYSYRTWSSAAKTAHSSEKFIKLIEGKTNIVSSSLYTANDGRIQSRETDKKNSISQHVII